MNQCTVKGWATGEDMRETNRRREDRIKQTKDRKIRKWSEEDLFNNKLEEKDKQKPSERSCPFKHSLYL